MKLIKVTTDLQISVHEFPQGTYWEQNRKLKELIGGGCSSYESVKPRRLYTELHHVPYATRIPGECVSMLADEEGWLKDRPVANLAASYLYESDIHGCPIVGNVLFIGEKDTGGEVDFCGLEESVLQTLYGQLEGLVQAIKGPGETPCVEIEGPVQKGRKI